MKYKKILIISIFALMTIMRFWKSEYIPFQSDGDELAYVFAGQSLLEYKIPISWSSFQAGERTTYETVTLGNPQRFSEDTFELVGPWFDHPPLLSILIGGFVKLFGYHFPTIPPSLLLHTPMIILSLLSALLLFKVSNHFFGEKAAIVSLILLSFSPSFNVVQRMVVGENLFIFLLLLSLYLAIEKKPLWLQSCTVALAPLAKIPGLLAIVILTLYHFVYGSTKKALIVFSSATIIFLGLFALYGYLIDWKLFISGLTTQSYRLVGWSNPTFIFATPGFHTKQLLDFSYYVLLILGLTGISFSKVSKDRMFVALAVIISLCFIWISGAEQDMLGWYRIPLFYMLSLSAGSLLSKEKLPFSLFVLLGICIIANLGLSRDIDHPLPNPWLLRTLVLGLMGLLFILLTKLKARTKESILAVLLSGYILVGLVNNHYLYNSWCEHQTCPIPEVIVSKL